MDQLDMAPRKHGIPSNVNVPTAAIGDYYAELLVIGARTTGTTPTSYGGGLLKQALAQNEARIKERVEHAARRWSCTFEEAWDKLVRGEESPKAGD